ncbi:hypothetical protein [Tatumella ptyseos]|uniref:Uncharacterized protein n=1 Tax=Tatumella ptyseos TaxID=82987 RepID=A0A2X5NRQ8_9GAMM|nr:hypothetical protein [Tatumella ptyseos]SQK76129.1 Uncharacterised protein [Tatumella ptyseos]
MKKTRMTYLISAVLLSSLVSSVAVRADDHGPWQPHGGGHQEGPGRGGPGGPGGPGHTADREAITVVLMAGLSHTDQALAAPAEETPLPGGDTALNPVSVFRMISAVHDTG